MNIAIDMYVFFDKGITERGIGLFTRNLLKSLFALDKKNTYFLFNCYGEADFKSLLEYDNNVHENYYCLGSDYYIIRGGRADTLVGKLINNFIKENFISVFLIPTYLHNGFNMKMSWLSEVKTITIVYDMIPFIFPEHYLKDDRVNEHLTKKIGEMADSDKLIAISECSKTDFSKFTNCSPDKIDVIYPGNSFILEYIENDEQAVLDRLNIRKPYFLSVSGDEYRKNNDALINAYLSLPKFVRHKYQLVIVCKIQRHIFSGLSKYIDQFKDSDEVVLTDFVSNVDLDVLYKNAFASVFVSQYEGFGLPVAEAMNYGLPIITSNNSSLKEISVDCAIHVDPFDIDDIRRGFEELLNLDNVKHFSQKSLDKSALYTWESSASKLLDSLMELAKDELSKVAKKKMAFFTPLPPIRSGISEYSVDMLNELCNCFDIDVFIDEGYTPNVNFNSNIRIANHREFESCAHRYEKYIFQIGCNKIHEYMFEYIRKYGGIVVLHEYNLQSILRQYSIKPFSGDFDLYAQFLSEDYKRSIVDEIITDTYLHRREIIHKYAANGFIVNYADMLIVHSEFARNKICAIHPDKSECTTVIPIYGKIGDKPNKKSEAKRLLGIDCNQVVIASFGVIAETKRLSQIIEAVKQLTASGKVLEYYIVGFLFHDVPYKDIISEAPNIHLVENVTSDMLNLYMDAADVCLNLRYPYHGENSAIITKMLARGTCCIINDIGSFSEYPDDCCVKLPSVEMLKEKEVETICITLEKLLDNPDEMKRIGDNALRYAKENLSIKKIAKRYTEILNDAGISLYSKQFLNSMFEDFNSFIPNKGMLDKFKRCINKI